MSLNIHSPLTQALAFGGGTLLEIFVYRKGEWDLFIPKLLSAYGFILGLIVFWTQKDPNVEFHEPLSSATRATAWLGIYHAAGIATSMVLYRLFFHRLRRFPGPFWARITNVYHTVLTAKHLHLYEEVEVLHKQYGDFVRIGPSELSIVDPAAIDAIYSAKSPCTKGPWYNILHPRIALNMIRDRKEHARRRKVWDRGFGARALRDYEPRVINYTDQLLCQIQATAGRPINVTDWFNFYSFDVMGDLAFGKSFNMLKDGVKHYFMKSLHAEMTNVGYLSHLPWLFPFLKITPILNTEHHKFWKWCAQQVVERRQMKPDKPDVFSWLLEDYESSPKSKEKELNLVGDSYLIVVAGSDTTAATLTSIFFELARSESALGNLKVELDEYFARKEGIDSISLSKLSYLDAVINEALRLHPAVPSGLQRETPAEGLLVGNTFIPGNTIVNVPLHTVFRDERFFERPLEFIPERWTTKPELTKNASVFTPFSTGLYSCIGKQLALMELRYVVSQVVHRFHVSMAPGQDEEAFLNGKKDAFTLALGPLNLVYTERT